MDKWKIGGIILVFISIALSLTNILSVKMTGAIVGIDIKSSLLTILTFVFFFVGLLFLSKIGKGLAALVITGSTIAGINKVHSDKQYIKDTQITAPYWTDQGRFQRTYRFDKILDKTEKKYELPRGLLKGLAMRESYGDPLKLNATKDGGAGMFMFSPGTGEAYGLDAFGYSKKTGVDKKHGAELKKLIKDNNYDYGKMAKIDERFDVRKSADAAGRFLIDLYKRYHSWDKALSAYNQGKPAPHPENTKHVKAVREYQKYYRTRDKRGRR